MASASTKRWAVSSSSHRRRWVTTTELPPPSNVGRGSAACSTITTERPREASPRVCGHYGVNGVSGEDSYALVRFERFSRVDRSGQEWTPGDRSGQRPVLNGATAAVPVRSENKRFFSHSREHGRRSRPKESNVSGRSGCSGQR